MVYASVLEFNASKYVIKFEVRTYALSDGLITTRIW